MKWQSYTHPISDVRDWSAHRRLELRPDFQRNEVWTEAAQIMLIDTILKGIPIPKVYIKSIIKDENTYRVVIDGQQRLTAILKFVKDELKLKLPYQGEHQNKTFSELPDDVKNEVLRYKIDINEIFNPTDDEIRDLYSRVNKYTVQLNKQELRRADFPGDFISLAETLAEDPFFEAAKIFTVKQRRRMLDVEYIEELLTIVLEGIQDKKDYIDRVCEENIRMGNKDVVYEEFTGIIEDITAIFDPEVFPIKTTRFRQRSDFYSLFAAVYQQRKYSVIDLQHLEDARIALREISEKVDPQSEDATFREYATRCLSDANFIGNRQWRMDLISRTIASCYREKGANGDIS